eukprot:7448489-Lingulodinium_polyedra.AAC.1
MKGRLRGPRRLRWRGPPGNRARRCRPGERRVPTDLFSRTWCPECFAGRAGRPSALEGAGGRAP